MVVAYVEEITLNRPDTPRQYVTTVIEDIKIKVFLD